MIPWFQFTQFSIGPLTIQVWGLFLALAFLVSIIASGYELKRKGLQHRIILDLSVWVIIGAIVGGRLFYVLNEWSRFQEQLVDIFKLWQGGMALYGGVIGGSLAAWLFIKRKKLKFGPYADAVLFTLPLGLFVGRIGCLMIHDHLGSVTTVPWGIEYLGQVRHETALYSLVLNLVLFIVLFFLRKAKFNFTGLVSSIFLIGYGLGRFVIDIFRAQDLPFSDPRFGGLTPSQYVSILLVIMGIWLWIRIKKQRLDDK
ncbi:MAG: prolipoprotein diacylglyceryl transferase [Patescibacteria group bacterium]